MVKGRVICPALLVSTVVLSGPASAQQLSQAALDQISASAAAICGDFDRGGFQSSATGNVSAEAELEGLVERLLNLGVEGAGKIESQQYANVLQEQLGEELRDNRACRMKIWNDLISVLSVASRPSTVPGEVGSSESEETGGNQGQGYVLPGGVMSGSVVRGPLLYCIVYNSEPVPIVLSEIVFGYTVASVIAIRGADQYETVRVPCERDCDLASGAGGTFDGPPNEPSFQEPTCSVRYQIK